MDHLSIKQERLGDGEMGGKRELFQHIQELEAEVAQMIQQLNSHAERQRSLAVECIGPGWAPQSTMPDTRSKERQVWTRMEERQSPASAHGAWLGPTERCAGCPKSSKTAGRSTGRRRQYRRMAGRKAAQL
ncbi:UNVERIFIED_CONTAM: hypothetical protein FKN15_016934 [Acipenser sinensis]